MHGLRRKVDLFITWFLWLSWQGEWKLLCSQVWSSFFPLRAWYWFKKLFSLYIENYFGIKYGSEWKGGSDSEYQNFLQAWLILKHSYNKLCCLIRNKSYYILHCTSHQKASKSFKSSIHMMFMASRNIIW